MKNTLLLIMTILVSSLSVRQAFSEGKPVTVSEVSIYRDAKAVKVGDVLSVIISESNVASKNAKTTTKKNNKSDAKGEATTGALKGLFPGMSGSMDITEQFSGQGVTSRSGQLTSRMTVKVIDTMPNGNLIIEGSKTMEINEDTEVVTISGVVRPEDISPSNTIYSYQIANAKVTYKGKGSVSQAHRPGIIVRVINWLL
jgi:flagellar L-ring protein FlgH